jgi:hypothetical protein
MEVQHSNYLYQGVSALLYPFKWDLVYVPLLSRTLIDHTEAPTPFVMGMHSSYLADIPSNREVHFHAHHTLCLVPSWR